jgi:hypothetical protein
VRRKPRLGQSLEMGPEAKRAMAHEPLLNDDPEQALTVRAEFALETGTTVVRTHVVQPGRRFMVWTGDVAELVGQRFAVTLEGTTADGVTPLAFVAERVTYWGDG